MFKSYRKRRSHIVSHASGDGYTPPQVAKRYNFPPGLTGNGFKVGIIELGGGFGQQDLAMYFASLGLPMPSVASVPVAGGSNTSDGPDGADGEVLLDIEVAAGVAPDASFRVYFAPNSDAGFAAAIKQARLDGCDAISISWGGSEDQWSTASIQAMEVELAACVTSGINVCVASGDSGSSDGETGTHVDYPASSPSVLGCGGTTLPASGAETGWSGSGGGVSSLFKIPAFQAGIGITGRGVPDVAGVADPNTGYSVLVDGQWGVIGGTSAVAPLWAGLVAILCQGLGKRVGFLPPLLYPLKGVGFSDIVGGNNGVYIAKKGYDLVTGWGTPDGTALLAALGGAVKPPTPTPVPVPPPTGALAPGTYTLAAGATLIVK